MIRQPVRHSVLLDLIDSRTRNTNPYQIHKIIYCQSKLWFASELITEKQRLTAVNEILLVFLYRWVKLFRGSCFNFRAPRREETRIKMSGISKQNELVSSIRLKCYKIKHLPESRTVHSE